MRLIIFTYIIKKQMSAMVNEVSLDEGHRLPTEKSLQNAAKLSIVEERPIMMDYWTDSLDKKVMIGVRNSVQPGIRSVRISRYQGFVGRNSLRNFPAISPGLRDPLIPRSLIILIE